MKLKGAFLIILFFIVCCNSVIGEEVRKFTFLNEKENDITLTGNDIEVMEDSSGYILEQVISSASHLFKKPGSSEMYNVDPSKAYWLKLNFKKSFNDHSLYFLEFWSWQADSIDFYYETEKGKWACEKVGIQRPYSNRPLLNKNLIFKLHFPDDTISSCYIRIRSSVYAPFDIHIKRAGFFIHYITNEYIILGLFYGIIFLLIFYNLLVFF